MARNGKISSSPFLVTGPMKEEWLFPLVRQADIKKTILF